MLLVTAPGSLVNFLCDPYIRHETYLLELIWFELIELQYRPVPIFSNIMEVLLGGEWSIITSKSLFLGKLFEEYTCSLVRKSPYLSYLRLGLNKSLLGQRSPATRPGVATVAMVLFLLTVTISKDSINGQHF